MMGPPPPGMGPPPGPPGPPRPPGGPPPGPPMGPPPGMMGGNKPLAPPPKPEEFTFHNLKIKTIKRYGCLKAVCIPPEEFLIDNEATSIGDARFCCHQTMKTRSELVEMGFDRDKVDELPFGDDDLQSAPEELARQQSFVSSQFQTSRLDHSQEQLIVYEVYALVDLDGDGVAEWTKCVMAGGYGEENILAGPEKWDDPIPFAEFTPMPVPHRRQGRSIADQTMDIQQIKTVLMRGTLDNVYETNNPQKLVIESEILNPDEVVNPNFNGVIRVKSNPAAVTRMQPNYVAPETFQMMSYLDDMIQKRTGVSRQTQALDPETMTNQSATAAQLQHDASYTMQELVARNLAEGGMRTLFTGLLKLYVKHQTKPEIIRLRNKFVEIDPRPWNADMDVSIDVGLGAGSRERDLTGLQIILSIQREIVAQFGPDNPVVPPSKLHNTIARIVETIGMRDATEYFADIPDEQLIPLIKQKQQEKPDPKMETEKKKVELQAQKQQHDMQMDQVKAQSDQQASVQKAQVDVQLAHAKMQTDQQANERKAMTDMQLAQAKMQAEMQLSREKMNGELQIMREKMQLEHEARIAEMNAEMELKRVQLTMGMSGPAETNVSRPQ